MSVMQLQAILTINNIIQLNTLNKIIDSKDQNVLKISLKKTFKVTSLGYLTFVLSVLNVIK